CRSRHGPLASPHDRLCLYDGEPEGRHDLYRRDQRSHPPHAGAPGGNGFALHRALWGQVVWYEEHFDIRYAIQREKSLKRWSRQWKIELIEKTNPEWHELFRIFGGEGAFDS